MMDNRVHSLSRDIKLKNKVFTKNFESQRKGYFLWFLRDLQVVLEVGSIPTIPTKKKIFLGEIK